MEPSRHHEYPAEKTPFRLTEPVPRPTRVPVLGNHRRPDAIGDIEGHGTWPRLGCELARNSMYVHS